MASALARHANAIAILVKQDRDRDKGTREKCQECACPSNTEVAIHSPCEKGKSGAKHGSNKVVSSKHASSVGGVSVGEVVQNRVL